MTEKNQEGEKSSTILCGHQSQAGDDDLLDALDSFGSVIRGRKVVEPTQQVALPDGGRPGHEEQQQTLEQADIEHSEE